MNHTEMKTLLKRYGFDDTDPLTVWINAALHEFEDEFSWPFLEDTETLRIEARTREPRALPADFRKLISLRDETNGQKLRYYETRRFEREFANPSETGNPEVYSMIGLETLRVWPVPTREVEFRLTYIRSVADLVEGTDVPRIPTQYHYTIVRGAAYIALQNENEEDRASVAYQAWIADVERAKKFYSSHEEDEPSVVENIQEY